VSEDALAIANLKATYCRFADLSTTDPDGTRAAFAELFTEDFVGDYGFRVLNGEREIAEFMIEAIGGGSEWMMHALGSPLIRVDGETATGDWTITVDSRRRDGEGLMRVAGRYSDTFRKTSAGWRIATIKFERYE
jgi:hypothetical protein